MTTDEARIFAGEIQERANHHGDRTGEGLHLGKCASVILGLAGQIDALTPPAVESKPKRAKLLSE